MLSSIGTGILPFIFYLFEIVQTQHVEFSIFAGLYYPFFQAFSFGKFQQYDIDSRSWRQPFICQIVVVIRY